MGEKKKSFEYFLSAGQSNITSCWTKATSLSSSWTWLRLKCGSTLMIYFPLAWNLCWSWHSGPAPPMLTLSKTTCGKIWLLFLDYLKNFFFYWSDHNFFLLLTFLDVCNLFLLFSFCSVELLPFDLTSHLLQIIAIDSKREKGKDYFKSLLSLLLGHSCLMICRWSWWSPTN